MKQPKLSDIALDIKGTKSIRGRMAKTKKVKITINVDEDLLKILRSLANSTGAPYQTLLNRALREALSSKTTETSRLDRLEREIEKLKKKVSA